MILFITTKHFKEVKVHFQGKKVDFIDVPKLIHENFGDVAELSEIRSWILNEMVRKKILGNLSSACVYAVCLRFPTIVKSTEPNLRKMLKESTTKVIEIKTL